MDQTVRLEDPFPGDYVSVFVCSEKTDDCVGADRIWSYETKAEQREARKAAKQYATDLARRLGCSIEEELD
jgi:hypothetical protein